MARPSRSSLWRRSSGVRSQLGGQDLDGDDPIEPGVLRAIDLPHSARADQREDFVRPQASPGGERHDVLNNFTPPKPVPHIIRRETLPAH